MSANKISLAASVYKPVKTTNELLTIFVYGLACLDEDLISSEIRDIIFVKRYIFSETV
jgi:hypothetical protein